MKRLIWILLFAPLCTFGQTKYLEVYRSANLYTASTTQSEVVEKVGKDAELFLLEEAQTENGYYHVLTAKGNDGFVYRTRVRGRIGTPDAFQSSIAPSNEYLRKDFWPLLDEMDDQLVIHEGYISCMSREHQGPKWVFYRVNKEMLPEQKAKGASRPSGYFRDPSYEDLKQTAFATSGYDHGHLAPAGVFVRDSAMYAESFYMTNMSPQHGCCNQKGWCLLESNVREWARDRPNSDFYLFSGSVFETVIDTLCLPKDIQVHVPGQYFKILLEVNNNVMIGSAAYIVDNTNVEVSDVASLSTTIDKVEAITGLNFFPNLTPSQERAFEAKKGSYEIENLPECLGRSKSCESVYARRTTPEERTKWNCD